MSTIAESVEGLRKAVFILATEIDQAVKQRDLLGQFVQRYADHSEHCRYPHLSCDCGFTKLRGMLGDWKRIDMHKIHARNRRIKD